MGPAALGLPTLVKLKLLQRTVTLVYKTLYNTSDKIGNDTQDPGLISNFVYDIKLKSNNIGHIESCRKVPFKLRDKL